MNYKQIVKTIGKWAFLKWYLANKIFKMKKSISVALTICPGCGIQEYIDHEGNYKSRIIR